jgi:alkylation response protein AidB-like acyl-CoA dehydrogenase
MPYPLSDIQEEMHRVIREFAHNELMPGASERDKSGKFPAELLRRLGELDAMGITVPEAYGGLGLDTQTQLLAIEEVAYADAALASIYTAHFLALEVLVPYASEAQKRRFLPPMAKGAALGAFALTEPDSGSDIGGMATVAKRDGAEWVISGSKTYISNAAEAAVIVLFAKTDPAAGFKGISTFIVGRDTPGISFSDPQDKCGIRSAPTYTVYLDELRVGDDLVVGELGSGGKMALSALNRARIDIAAMANGVAMRAFQLAEEFATARVQFNQKIRDFQAIQLMLGEMDAQLEVARLTAWWAAAIKDSGADVRREGSIAKWIATENCCAVVDKAVQVHGGAGFMRESEIERLYRDSRVLRIFEGTSQIQLITVAGTLASAFDRTGVVV